MSSRTKVVSVCFDLRCVLFGDAKTSRCDPSEHGVRVGAADLVLR
jgi:hypothetical protein